MLIPHVKPGHYVFIYGALPITSIIKLVYLIFQTHFDASVVRGNFITSG